MFQYLLVMAAIAVPGVLIALALIAARVLDYLAHRRSSGIRRANYVALARAELAQQTARDLARIEARS